MDSVHYSIEWDHVGESDERTFFMHAGRPTRVWTAVRQIAMIGQKSYGSNGEVKMSRTKVMELQMCLDLEEGSLEFRWPIVNKNFLIL